MAMFFDTFPVPQTQGPLQIIQYDGPPKPKQTSRRNPSKVPSSADGPRSNTEQGNKEDLVLTSDGVEVIDLTCLAGEGNCEISGSGGGGRDDVWGDDGFPYTNERESARLKQIASMQTSREDTGDKSSDQPAPSERSSRVNAVVIEDSQSDSDTDEGGSHEDDTGTRIGDQLAVSSISTLECRGRECPTGAEDAINPEAVDGAGTQASGPPRRKLASTPPTSSSMMYTEQPAQEASGQRPMPEKAEREGKFPTIRDTGSSGSDTDNDDPSGNHNTCLTGKRKRSPPPKCHSRRKSNITSKQCSEHAAHSARQRKPSPTARGRPLFNRPSALNPLSAEQYSDYDANTCYSDDSSDDSSEGRSKSRARHLGSNERPVSTARPIRSRRHKRKCNRSTVDDAEYEVEMILDARINGKRLQYRVKWLGYEDDPEWYDASNFKNSPHKLYDFHTADYTRPGPPKRLERWVQCWEKDRDADNHPDDNKPKRSHTRGGTL